LLPTGTHSIKSSSSIHTSRKPAHSRHGHAMPRSRQSVSSSSRVRWTLSSRREHDRARVELDEWNLPVLVLTGEEADPRAVDASHSRGIYATVAVMSESRTLDEAGSDLEQHYSEELLRAVADLVLRTTYDGVWLVNKEGITTFVNPRMAEMLGFTVGEMLGTPSADYSVPERRDQVAGVFARRREGIREQVEWPCVRKDGSTVWVLATANPVYDRDGRYAGALALVADLSVQKERERALVDAKADLDRQLAELEQRRAAVELQACLDPLTQLFNQRYLLERLAQEVARCQRHSHRLCLLYVDLDGMGRINERFGRTIGDAVLTSLGLTLLGDATRRGVLRASDVAARHGGDEIVILAPMTDLAGGYALAERIIDAVRASTEPAVDGARVPFSLSIGVAACPFHAATPETLLAAADKAMRRARADGGGRVCLAGLRPSGAPP
jgi:diguanylate cyclase (GGDEF)-like protein/PAS domain S-box-containing protein